MIGRRGFLASGAAALLAGCDTGPGYEQVTLTTVLNQEGATRDITIPAAFMPTNVPMRAAHEPGVIHVDVEGTWLYLTLPDAMARRYKIAVGAAGNNFKGTAQVRRKAEWPRWTPTANMIRQEPEVYAQSAGGLPGGHPRNPLGARALYLYQDGRDTLYRIHGTPQPWTIGMSFSSGCIRMINEHMIDLYERVPMGTTVKVE